jgi:drug/metabolite transporter (DMT)-like permease
MAGVPYIGELLATGAAVFWAIGVILFKRSAEGLPPLALNLFKNTLAIVLLIPTALVLGGQLAPAEVSTSDWLLVVGSGVVGISLADTAFFFSLEKLGAGLTAVVDSSYTPLMLGVSFLILDEQIGPPVLIGAGLVMGGMVIGSWTRPPAGKTRRDLVLGTLVGVVGIGLMAVSIVAIKPILNEVPVLWATWVRLGAGGVGLLPLILLHPRRRQLLATLKPGRSWRFAVPAAFSGSYLAMICWIGGMKYTDVSVATILNQLSTIFIFVLAVVFLKEGLTWRRVLAIVLAFCGGMLVALRDFL